MVNIIHRMRKLKALFDIRFGPGAAVLPPSVTRLHLEFAFKNDGGHFGGRKFWRMYLPRLKYYNPGVSMTVVRSRDKQAKDGSATLTIFFDEPSVGTSAVISTSPTTAPAEALAADFPGRIEVIDMKHKHESEILKQVMELTQATPVSATPEEEAEMQALEEQKKKSAQDTLRSQKLNDLKRQEEALLEQARGVMAT